MLRSLTFDWRPWHFRKFKQMLRSLLKCQLQETFLQEKHLKSRRCCQKFTFVLHYISSSLSRRNNRNIREISMSCFPTDNTGEKQCSLNAFTLLKIKVLKMFFTAMPQKNHFWFHREPFSQRLFKEPSLAYLFII